MERTVLKRETTEKVVIQALRDLMAVSPEVRGQHMAGVANAILDYRGSFEHEGHPDWAGRSQDYREAMREAYRVAGVPSDSAGSLQSSIRYHVGTAARERLSAEELSASGLDAASPAARARKYRQSANGRAARMAGASGSREFEVLPASGRRGQDRLVLDSRDPYFLLGLAIDALSAAARLRGSRDNLLPLVSRAAAATTEVAASLR